MTDDEQPFRGLHQCPGEPQGALGEDAVLEPIPADELERDYAAGVVPRPPERSDAERARLAADVEAARHDELIAKYRADGLEA